MTSDDVIVSLQRWGSKDATGQKLMSFVKAMTAVDAEDLRDLPQLADRV